jgi:hypothetical protein
MATHSYGKITQCFKGDWSSTTTYFKDDIVSRGGALYICTKNGTLYASNGPLVSDDDWNSTHRGASYVWGGADYGKYKLNTDNWKRFGPEVQHGEWKGQWSAGTTYFPGDIVTYYCGPDGQWVHSYYCLRLSNGDDPFWNLGGSWEVFLEGGGSRHHRRIVRLGTEQPIGWRGHPSLAIPKPSWGGNTWQGNIPFNVDASEVHARKELRPYGLV